MRNVLCTFFPEGQILCQNPVHCGHLQIGLHHDSGDGYPPVLSNQVFHSPDIPLLNVLSFF